MRWRNQGSPGSPRPLTWLPDSDLFSNKEVLMTNLGLSCLLAPVGSVALPAVGARGQGIWTVSFEPAVPGILGPHPVILWGARRPY